MRLLLVNMPFSANRPAIGPSLLKAHLDTAGHPTRVLYLDRRFREVLGAEDYEQVSYRAPSQSLAGDWVFSPCLFAAREQADVAYIRSYRERFGGCEQTLDATRRARALAPGFLDACLDGVEWHAYDVVGFTSTFTQHVASLAMARRVKERFPRSVIVFGGANCEAEMGLQVHRAFPFVDFVCSGEADVSFPQLIRTLATGGSGHGIPGVIWRDQTSRYRSLVGAQVQNLDSLPYPDYSDYFEPDAAAGARPPRVALMETSRGCWWGQKHHCTFCGLNGTSMAFRSKSADRVLAEIDALCQRYRLQGVEMVDNILDLAYFRDLLPELARRKLKLGLFYETKANLSKERLRALRDAGVAAIQPGIESFSTDVLRIMRKGTSGIQNVQLLKWCQEFGIRPYWNLIYGFPGEDPEDYRRMVGVIERMTHLRPPEGAGPIRLDRFSPNFTSAHELGFREVRPDRSYGYIYDLPPDVLFELAYYFEYDYADGRVPASYAGAAERAVQRWRESWASHGLVYADHGDTLAIWDFRPGATQRLTILTASERALYLFCDQHRSLARIESFMVDQGADPVEVKALLERLVAQRLMLSLDGRYLSLAVSEATSLASQATIRSRAG